MNRSGSDEDKWSRSTRMFTFIRDDGESEVVLRIQQNIARTSGPRSHEQWWLSSTESEASAFDGSGSVVWDSGNCLKAMIH